MVHLVCPILSKLNILLNIDEYKENANITVNEQERNGETVPFGLHFENASGDFKNDYRFMSKEVVEEKLKRSNQRCELGYYYPKQCPVLQDLKCKHKQTVKKLYLLQKLKAMILKFFLGDSSTHAGNFVFQANVQGALNTGWSWP